MSTFSLDVRYAVRMLIRDWQLTVACLLAIGFGVSVNTSLYTVVNTVLLRPLPYTESDRLMFVAETNAKGKAIRVSSADFKDWRERTRAFSSMTAYDWGPVNLVGGSGEPQRIEAAAVAPGFLKTFGVTPVVGRDFVPEEEVHGGRPAALISHGMWMKRFGGGPGVIGTSVQLAGMNVVIAGVLPASFQYPAHVEAWIPRGLFPDISARSAHNVRVVGRLKPGVSIAQADADMRSIAARLAEEYPRSNREVGAVVIPLQTYLAGDQRLVILMLMSAALLVLIVATVNIANLTVARSVRREVEVAIRLALGASRGALLKQLLTEGILLALCGGVFGVLTASWALSLFTPLIPPDLILTGPLSMDLRVFAFALGLTVMIGVFFGLAPAVHSLRSSNIAKLRTRGAGASGGSSNASLRNILVGAEVCVTVVVLVGFALMSSSMLKLLDVDLGFNSNGLLSAEVSLPDLPPSKYADAKVAVSYFDQFLARTSALPGVDGVALINNPPLSGRDLAGSFSIERGASLDPSLRLQTSYRVVSGGYFRTAGIPILRGRALTTADVAGTTPVAVVNKTMVTRYWPGQDPIGQRIKLDGLEPDTPWVTIVGVSSDVRHQLSTLPEPEAYVPYQQHPEASFGLTLLVRSSIDQTAAVRSVVRALDPEIPVVFQSMDQMLTASIANPRLRTTVLGAFAALAILLAVIGVYAVTSNATVQRRREIAIRMALGADRSRVIHLIWQQGMIPVGIGIVAGCLTGVALNRLWDALLFDTSAIQASMYIFVALLLAAISAIASFVPAWRATSADPLATIRTE